MDKLSRELEKAKKPLAGGAGGANSQGGTAPSSADATDTPDPAVATFLFGQL
jgi:hypothetical protein